MHDLQRYFHRKLPTQTKDRLCCIADTQLFPLHSLLYCFYFLQWFTLVLQLMCVLYAAAPLCSNISSHRSLFGGISPSSDSDDDDAAAAAADDDGFFINL